MQGKTYQRTTAGSKTFLPIVMAVLVLGGCTADTSEPAAEVETITGATEGDPIVVDLRDAERGWLFDSREGDLPIDRVLLICPDGGFMRLSHWLSEQERQLGFDDLGEQRRALFSLGPTEEIASTAIERVVDDCVQECRQCPDGAWLCIDPCRDTGNVWNTTPDSGRGNIDGPDDGSGGGGGHSGGSGYSGSGGGGGTPEPYDPRDPAPPSF